MKTFPDRHVVSSGSASANSGVRLKNFSASPWLAALALFALAAPLPAADDLAWPAITRTQRPWAYWWWMASAVDQTNLTRELNRYHDAGMGGVHIIPIYGAKGFESNYITYLSPRWMDMLRFTVATADHLDLGIDMTTGSGWCFGGPRVTDDEANASVVVNHVEITDTNLNGTVFDAKTTQALMAFGPDGKKADLLSKLSGDGAVDWTAEGGPWRVFAVSQKPSGQKVKRAGPGGEGWMLNLFYPKAMTNFLAWFDEAFANYPGPKPRAMYHDSYEYRSEWAPDLFAQFEKRRGYRLQDELPALFDRADTDAQLERAGRVKCDYRQTISEMMSDVTLPMWVKWSHDHGFITRNEAHGSPGNLLDLYGVADIPETEMFHLDRNKLVSKFSSSAAHVMGRQLSSSETGTWLEEHFTETLADMKFLLDDLFLSGVNHIFYHGTCYSPDEAGWPGWVFYASFEMNPRNSVWHDVKALNTYAARCQSVLQAGKPDNDVLLYWPIWDRWSSPTGSVLPFTVHARDWLEQQPIGKAAEKLWSLGYQFDYVSDKQLALAKVKDGKIEMPGGSYRVVVVPKCQYMPLETLSNLVAIATAGATIMFEDYPKDVSGLADLEQRHARFQELLGKIFVIGDIPPLRKEVGRGLVLVGSPESTFAAARPETLFDRPGLMCIRRAVEGGRYYFIANRGDKAVDGWVSLSTEAKSVVILDPLTGNAGVAKSRLAKEESTEVYLQLPPGGSIILRTFTGRQAKGAAWTYWSTNGTPTPLQGTWQVKFLQGGPVVPAAFTMQQPGSWTSSSDTNAHRFAGSALYTVKFDAPNSKTKTWQLDLGKVCQSARVRLNGKDLGTLFTAPFRMDVSGLKRKGNVLEVEVTNVSANRIRDLDRRGVVWQNFRDINFVNLNYRPFNAADWPLTDSGLLGPVTLAPLAELK